MKMAVIVAKTKISPIKQAIDPNRSAKSIISDSNSMSAKDSRQTQIVISTKAVSRIKIAIRHLNTSNKIVIADVVKSPNVIKIVYINYPYL